MMRKNGGQKLFLESLQPLPLSRADSAVSARLVLGQVEDKSDKGLISVLPAGNSFNQASTSQSSELNI